MIKKDGKKQLIAKEGGFLSLPGYSSAYFITLFIISNDV